jgi:hypothetical protein
MDGVLACAVNPEKDIMPAPGLSLIWKENALREDIWSSIEYETLYI